VFSSDHVSDEDALAALRAHRDEDLGEVSYYRFDSGFYEDPWVGNCVATGNAQGFIEPSRRRR